MYLSPFTLDILLNNLITILKTIGKCRAFTATTLQLTLIIYSIVHASVYSTYRQ